MPQDVTRRDFVKSAGAVSTAAAAVTALEGAPAIQTVKAANNQVQYGVIGTGSRGQYLLRHTKSIDSGRCVAVCDVFEPNLNAGAQIHNTNPKKFKDYRELLAQKDVDCVIIATPLYQHFPVTRDALLAGKHVFCEKSLVFKPEEVHALRALANERSKQVLQVGLQRRYSKFYQTAKQMVDKGVLGQVTHMSGQWHRNTFSRDPWNRALPPGTTDRQYNWRKYREFSGGLTAELGSHQIDVADWMFGSIPEYVVGVGGLDYIKDGRDIYDNIQLIFKYPKGQKMTYTSMSTNQHLALFGGARNQFGEMIMGTDGTIEITVGTDDEPAIGLFFREPARTQTTPAGAKKEGPAVSGASLAGTGSGSKGIPILFEKDEITGKESFIEKELKFARRWLYSKGVMVPEEDKNPVDVEMEAFFESVRTSARPKADLEVGLADSTAVILANLAMDEGRRIYFSEIDKMGRGEAPKTKKG
ncbi:MAG: Gfo/Idh/MocA family protein [Bryobacteraceae bacterium]